MIRIVLLLWLAAATGCSTIGAPDGGTDAGADAGMDGGVDAGPCGPATCQAGCCDSAGVCHVGNMEPACGHSGGACVDCSDGGWWCVGRSCVVNDGSCFAAPVPGASWETGDCPVAGCPAGSYCVRGVGESSSLFGCLPIPVDCQGRTPDCACMGCICGIRCQDLYTYDDAGTLVYDAGFACDNGTISRRASKEDILYVSDAERKDLARQALDIKLARYRYKNEPPSARRRLGFIIDDQPDTSPAVMDDRTHVDEYGYTSMLLVLVQQQQRELEALRARVEQLERAKSCR